VYVQQTPPTGGPLKALIFDSYYDAYRGVVRRHEGSNIQT
jgi:translation elongation factor EF-4